LELQKQLPCKVQDLGKHCSGTMTEQDVESRRNMPVQLARHHSSLNQVSRRPDFAAAMSAVRASWREEEMDRSTVDCVRAAEVLQDDMHEQSSLDAIWASISHID